MPYQSFFASKPSSAPTKQTNGASGYASYFGGTTIAQPASPKTQSPSGKAATASQKLAASPKQAAAVVQPTPQPAPQKSQSPSGKPKSDNQKTVTPQGQATLVDKPVRQSPPPPSPKGKSLFSKVRSNVKDFASSATAGEQKLAQGVARVLPGGNNDLKAQQQSAEQDTKNLKTYTDLHKSGKISDKQYKKLTGTVAQQSSDTQKGTTEITKKMPTKTQIGLGAASTAADIVTAGTLPEIKGTVVAAKTAETASKGAKLIKAAKATVPAVAGNAVAGGLNAAAGGGTKGDVIKNAAAGAALPEALHYAAKGVSKLLPKAASKVEQKVAEDVKPTTTHGLPQPGDIIKPTPMEPTPVHAKVAEDVTNRAHIENPVVQQKMQTVAKDVEGTYKPNPVPDAHATLDKAVTEHNGAVGEVPTVGGTLVVKDHSPAGVAKAVKGIKEQYPTAEKVPSDIPGQTKVKITTDSGHSGEITISSPEVAQASKLQADMVKNTAEAGPAHTAAAEEQSTALYKNANEAADTRLKEEQATAASKETPAAKPAPAKVKMVEKPPLKPFETAHMETVGGYTHSTHMEQEYADMLRGQEQSLKGGQLIKNGDGTYRRTSEHSKFYRDYYKEYGRAPSKEAYLDEARRQLSSGHAAYGASKDYKELLERENRPIPTMDVKTTPQVPKKEVAHTEGNSRVYERLKAEHPDALSEDVKYDKLNLKEDAAKATDLVAKDKNKAYRVAMGAEDIKGQTNTAVNIALSEKALEEGNHSLYAQLVKNRSLEQTRRGQEIVAEKGSVTDNSTSRYVKELLASRMQKLGKGFTSDINTKLVKTDSSAKRAVAMVDKEVAKAQKRIQYKQMDMKNAQSILEQLTCK